MEDTIEIEKNIDRKENKVGNNQILQFATSGGEIMLGESPLLIEAEIVVKQHAQKFRDMRVNDVFM